MKPSSLLPRYLLFLCGLLALSLSVAQAAANTRKKSVSPPNILFILVDDMGWTDTSVPFHRDKNGTPLPSANNKIFKTPGMEKLAAQGMIFTQAYAPSVCSPSRTAIMTGLNPSRTHITNWTSPASPADTSMKGIKEMRPPQWRIEGLTKKDPSMAKMFRGAGYKTIFVGKAHFGPTSNRDAQPEAQGFDVNIGGCGAGQPGSYLGHDNYAERATRDKPQLGPRDVPNLDKYHGTDVFLTDALTNEITREIKTATDKKQPFFAYMGHYAVHGPLMFDKQFGDLYPDLKGALRNYATLISGMDRSLLTLLEKLDEYGVAENTLIVFASDNGGTAPKNNPCAPLRGMKGTPYEGGIRTPLIIAWAKPDPANPWQKRYPAKPGSHSDRIIALQDLFATFGSIIGAKIPRSLDSFDCSGYLKEDDSCKRTQSYFLNFPHEHQDHYYTLYREGDWKIIYRYLEKSWELYNLAEDTGEKNNLAQKEPARLKEMAQKLVEQHKLHGSQLPTNTATGKPAVIELPRSA